MKTLVTGGSGFIGQYVVRDLLDQNREVLILDRTCDIVRRDDVERFYGDVSDLQDVTEAMSHVDSWIHLAGVLGTQETISNPFPAVYVNVLGGLNVLQAARQYQLPGVAIAVGNHWMNNTYAITKSTMERFCQMYREEHGLPVTVVRALNAYGPGQVPAAPYGPSKVRKIMPAFICRALTQTPLEVYGDGTQVMDMIHARDVASILTTALEHTIHHGGVDGVVEAGTGRATTVNDIALAVQNDVRDLTSTITYLPMRPGEPPQSHVRGEPATLKWIGYDRKLTALEDGVAETVQWFRDNWLPRWRRG